MGGRTTFVNSGRKEMLSIFVRPIAICALLVAIPAHAQEARWGSPDDPTVKEMLAAEKMWLDTNCGPQPGLEKYFASEFQGTAIDGKRYPREDVLSPGSDQDCRLGEVKYLFFGELVAVAYGSESSIRTKEDGSEWKRCLAWTDTWLKRDGKWQIIAAQDNVVTCE